MLEWFAIKYVLSNGAESSADPSRILDDNSGATTFRLFFSTANYAQNPTPASTAFNIPSRLLISGSMSWANVGTAIGTMQATSNGSATTTGQTLYGVAIGDSSGNAAFDVLFTTPQTAPNGTFQPVSVFQVQYGRSLSN